MKLLLDQGLPFRNAALLRAQGVDGVHTEELGLARASDREILARARREQRAVVTLDADFHTLLAHSGESTPSVIRLRIEGLSAEGVAALVPQVLQSLTGRESLAPGIVASVSDAAPVRVRALPL
jgi:predicted nuclease of predicted toxin-antitoxin system